MIEYFVIEIKKYLASNQFASGGLFIFALTSIGGLVWKIYPVIKSFLIRRLIVTIDMQSNDEVFRWLMIWLSNHKYGKKTKILTAFSSNTNNCSTEQPVSTVNGEEQQKYKVEFSPGEGNHFFFYKGRLVKLSRSRENSNQGGMFIFHEQFQITMIGKNANIAKQLIQEAAEFAQKRDMKSIGVYANRSDYWNRLVSQQKRSIDTVILPKRMQFDVLDDAKNFLSNRQWYYKRGIPYRRGYLFYGKPGTGKTSLVKAIASELNIDIYLLNLSGTSNNDLMTLISGINKRSIILFEDVDVAFEKRNSKDDKSSVTFSGLLNAVDGIICPDGLLMFMTTNHIEMLDESLIRPGRIDLKIEFTDVDKYQIDSLFKLFYTENNGEVKQFIKRLAGRKLTAAQLQKHFIENYTACDAVENVDSLF